MSRRRIKNPKKHGSARQKESTKESTQKRQEISFEELKSIVARAKELGRETRTRVDLFRQNISLAPDERENAV